MDESIIKVEALGKKYIIAHERSGGYTALRDVLTSKAKELIKKKNELPAREEFWALKDVAFEIKKGEAVGIIGRNGAGKSTLLKVLSRITEPSTGRIELNGRVASLLEVGTGFHPELTGRENVFLNGAILGMTRAEIRKKFDEIVDFSGVEKFLDTPVKRYSSGMYVRLAFAVAAHLEPEILVIDEVLAVGDAEFQKKCLGKMQDVSNQDGRTVLFVSHNMAAVKSLCTKGIVLQNGKVAFEGNQIDAVNFYQANHQTNSFFEYGGTINSAPGNSNIRILKFDINPRKGESLSIYSGIDFNVDFYNAVENKNIDITFELENQDNILVFHYGTILTNDHDSKKGIYTLKCGLPTKFLNAGTYSISIIFGENQRYVLYKVKDFVSFEVLPETSGSNSNTLPGITIPELQIEQSFKLLENAGTV
jgi:lipopolysaccharide transport system ATP-binding protein